jgi:hypothetical protein
MPDATNMLTIADVYKPISAVEYMQFQQAAMQNRIAQMQMDEYQRDIGFSQSVANALMQIPAAPTPTAPRAPIARATPTAMPGGALMPGAGTPSGGIQPGVTPPAPAIQPPPAPAMQEQLAPLIKMAGSLGIPPEVVQRDPAGFYRWAQAQQAKNLQQIKDMGSFIKEVGLDTFKRLANSGDLSAVFPLLNKFNIDDLTAGGNGDFPGTIATIDIPGVGKGIAFTGLDGKVDFRIEKDPEKGTTEEKLLFDAFEKKYLRPPTSQEKLDLIEGWKKRTAEDRSMAGLAAYIAKYNATQQASAAGLTEENLQPAVWAYINSGGKTKPSFGRGAQAAWKKFYDAVTNTMRTNGLDPKQMPALGADFAATSVALRSLATASANFNTFQSAMIKNADYAASLSAKFPRTEFPDANTVLNAIRRRTGNALVVEFGNATYAACLEYEKIRTAGTNVSSAELSVGAQAKAEELLNTSQNHEQLVAAIRAMKTDAANIIGSKHDELQTLRSTLSNIQSMYGGQRLPTAPPATPPPTTPAPGVTIWKFDAQGNRIQ